jgi:hypothetical protein
MADLATRETAELLADLDRRTRDAWIAYRDRLGGLSGREYDAAERDSWATLQADLRAIDGDRSDLAEMVAADDPDA